MDAETRKLIADLNLPVIGFGALNMRPTPSTQAAIYVAEYKKNNTILGYEVWQSFDNSWKLISSPATYLRMANIR